MAYNNLSKLEPWREPIRLDSFWPERYLNVPDPQGVIFGFGQSYLSFFLSHSFAASRSLIEMLTCLELIFPIFHQSDLESSWFTSLQIRRSISMNTAELTVILDDALDFKYLGGALDGHSAHSFNGTQIHPIILMSYYPNPGVWNFLVASEFLCNHWPSIPQTSSEYGLFCLLFEYKKFSGENEPRTTAERSRW